MKRTLPTLLIIDDRDAYVWSRLLRRKGINVTANTSAEDALEWLKDNDVELVITDLSLPKMDGLTFIENLRKQDKKQRVWILSGYEIDEPVKRIAERHNVEKILSKEITITDLAKEIKG